MSAEDILLKEFDARTADLAAINEIFDGGDEDSYAFLREGLLSEVMKRQGGFSGSLSSTGFASLDRIPDGSQAWQDQIFRLAVRFGQMRRDLVAELDSRTSDLDKVISVLSGVAKPESLDDVLLRAEQRHAEQAEQADDIRKQLEEPAVTDTEVARAADNQQWRDLIQSAKDKPSEVESAAVKGDFGKVLAECMMNELSGRVDDLNALAGADEVKSSSMDPAADSAEYSSGGGSRGTVTSKMTKSPEEVQKECKERQEILEEKLRDAGDCEDDEEFTIEARAAIIDDYVKDDERWRNALGDTGSAPAAAEKTREQRDLAREEMIGRVEDLAALRALIQEKEANEEMEEEELIEKVGELVKLIKERHNDIEPRVEEQLTDADIAATVAMLITPDAVADAAGGGGLMAAAGAPPTVPPPAPGPPPAPTSAAAEDTKVDPTTGEYIEESEDEAAGLPDPTVVSPVVDAYNSQDQVQIPGEMVESAGVADGDQEAGYVPPSEKVEVMMTPMEAFKQNDEDWRAAFKDLIRSTLGVEPPIEEEPKEKWWLDKDDDRCLLIDSITMYEERDELLRDAVYLDRVLRLEDDEPRLLYIPFYDEDAAAASSSSATGDGSEEKSDGVMKVPDWSNHVILSTLFDGGMVANFLDMCEPDFMDVRVIHQPDLEEPMPLSDGFVEDNVQLCMSTAKALGIRLPTYDAKDWLNGEKHVSVLLALLRALIDKNLARYVSIQEHPELIRLAQDSEDSDAVDALTPYDWIPRWLNRTLKRGLLSEIDNYNDDLMKALAAIDPSFTPPVKDFNDDPELAATAMIDYLKGKGLETSIQPVDLVAENKVLQDLLAGQIMNFNSGLAKLTKREQKRFQSIVLTDAVGTGDEGMVNFLNSFVPPEYAIKNLNKDLSDGVVILKIIDKVQPGIVDWTKVRDRGKIRHKFDKMGNCNYAMKLAADTKGGLGLKLVGAGGQDLHDGNQKIIHSLLWQIMRYDAIKRLRDLAIDGKQIDEDDILVWANEMIAKAQVTAQELSESGEDYDAKCVSVPLTSFRDKQLCSAIFYLELFDVMVPDAVRKDLIQYDIPAVKDLRRGMDDEDENKKRLLNARYVMTLARREGAELFVLPEDLIVLEHKAVLSMFAALMTIHFQIQNEEERKPVSDEVAAELGTAFNG